MVVEVDRSEHPNFENNWWDIGNDLPPSLLAPCTDLGLLLIPQLVSQHCRKTVIIFDPIVWSSWVLDMSFGTKSYYYYGKNQDDHKSFRRRKQLIFAAQRDQKNMLDRNFMLSNPNLLIWILYMIHKGEILYFL